MPSSLPILRLSALALAATLSFAPASHAASANPDAELSELRQAVQLMRAQYESRLQALEQRLQQAEARANSAPQPSDPITAGPNPARPTSGSNSFNLRLMPQGASTTNAGATALCVGLGGHITRLSKGDAACP